MEVIVANSAGFCFGVKRAINMANTCAAEHKDDNEQISTLGPIIHNPQVVKSLEDKNIFAKSTVDEIDNGTVIIRSHGVTMKEFKDAKDKGLEVLDATCPFVTRVQNLVSELVKDDYYVVIVGEHDHPEVRGVISYAEGYEKICVALTIDELKGFAPQEKIGIVAQTTLSIEQLKEVASYLLELGDEVKVFNTICDATSVRQEESREIAANVESMVVIGGRNSANTNRLQEICSEIQPKTHHIETAEEIDPKWFTGLNKIGVTAGASTPSWIIEGVVDKINEILGKTAISA